jgi:heme/copper-type cytochrome/quinol oxidase subunit 4
MDSFMPFALAILATTAFAGMGTLVVRLVVNRTVSEGHNAVLVPIFQTSGTIYAVFLAFLVVAVWQAYDAAHDNLAEEASALTTLYRASAGMEKAPGDALRRLIRNYTTAVVEEEWPVQAASGGTSPTARAAALSMYRLFQHLPPDVQQRDTAIDGAVLSILNQIMADRNKRTLEAGESLPTILWGATIGIGMIVVMMSFFLHMEERWPHMASASVMTAVIAMLVCIIFVMSRSFVGPMALSADPFRHALELYDTVDATP